MIRSGRLALLLVAASAFSLTTAQPKVTSKSPLQWDWSKINVNEVSFPQKFGWGAATSAYQIEGNQGLQGTNIKNSWTESDRAPQAGIASGHWDRYKEDVQLIKQAGLTEYRFSIKWSVIEPEPGKFDQEAMQHYIDLVDELKANGIEPFVNLFHHAWPTWFGDKGDFQKQENIKYFTRFAKFVFGNLRDSVKMWMTFNEPAGYCLEGYFRGKYPPYKKSLKLAGKSLKNMLDAHVSIYHHIKERNKECQVGLAKMFVPMDSYQNKSFWKRGLNWLAVKMFEPLQNDVALDYLRTGKFNWGFRLYGRVTGKNKFAKGAIDYVALNYYTGVLLDVKPNEGKRVKPLPGRPVSDNGKAVYPEGLWRSIQKCAKKLPGVPIWIGENGICDAKDTKREDYFKKHLWVVWYALQKGYDIRGYHTWTLMDSFNWNSGFSNRYGLYKVDFDTFERTLRDGAKSFVHLAKNGAY